MTDDWPLWMKTAVGYRSPPPPGGRRPSVTDILLVERLRLTVTPWVAVYIWFHNAGAFPVQPTWAANTYASLPSCLHRCVLQSLSLHSWNVQLCQGSICNIFFRRSPYGAVAKVLNCDIVESQLKFQSCYYIHFRTNTLGLGMNPLTPSYGLNRTTNPPQGWFWHSITLKGWYAMKQRNQTYLLYVEIYVDLKFFLKIGDRSRGRPEGSLFDRYYSEVYGRALVISLDCSTLPFIHTL